MEISEKIKQDNRNRNNGIPANTSSMATDQASGTQSLTSSNGKRKQPKVNKNRQPGRSKSFQDASGVDPSIAGYSSSLVQSNSANRICSLIPLSKEVSGIKSTLNENGDKLSMQNLKLLIPHDLNLNSADERTNCSGHKIESITDSGYSSASGSKLSE